MNSLTSIGLNDQFNNYISQNHIADHEIGRILRHDKTQYIVKTGEKEAPGELTGNLLHSDSQYPVVGDWVHVVDFDGKYIITQLFPRYSQLSRKSIQSSGKAQLIAANIDQAFIVQGADHDFNLNRLERYITMAYDGGIKPIVILNKADLVSKNELKMLKSSIGNRINEEIQLLTFSTLQDKGLASLRDLMKPATTSCFIGSSGVGKSSIINQLLNTNQQSISNISSATAKGRHTTTSRQLFFLEDGSMVIDTPGMRELGMSVSEEALQTGFVSISELAKGCRFSDCTHLDEPGCSVQKAVACGQLVAEQLENYHKLKSESQHFQKTKAEINREGKRFGKIYKEAQAYRKFRKL